MPSLAQLSAQFDNQYLLGDEAMDEVHREFVALCNTVATAQGAEFGRQFRQLFEHTRQHFADEEQRMQESDFPAYGEHRADHQRILGDMDRFSQRAEAGRSAMARAWLGDSLPNWFDNHARTMDSALAAHLKR